MLKHKTYIDIVCTIITLWALRWLREYLSTQWWHSWSIFPAPTQFMASIINSDFKVWVWSQAIGIRRSIISSLYRVIVWLCIGIIWALFIWSCISTSIWIKRIVLPIIQLFAPIAPIAWISIALVLFGIGNKTAIFIVFMGVFFSLTLTTVKAIENTPKRMLYISKNLWNTPFQTWYRIIVPSILPNLFTMLRINLMAARMAVLAAEMTGLRDWLWAIIMTWRNLFDYDLIVFGMFLIAIIGFLTDSLLVYIQQRYLWRDTKVL